MKFFRYLLSLLLFVQLHSPLLLAQTTDWQAPRIFRTLYPTALAYADSVMKGMSQEEMIAQMIMPMVYPSQSQEALSAWDDMVVQKKYGGVLWQKGDPRTQLALTNRMRQKAKIPMLVAMDGEWGLSMRLSHTLRYPKNIVIGAGDSPELAREYGKAVAQEARRMGIHVNFAPTIDVNNNPKNPVINTRSFGSDPALVSRLGIAYSEGLEAGRVLSCAKHFPGHGNTDSDSHKTLPYISASRTSLEQIELVPFSHYISRGLGAIMTAHLNVPALGTNGLPASLSRKVVGELLQEQLRFKGLIFTDGLNMAGVKVPGVKSIAVSAFLAGNDILLASPSPAKDLQELKEALKRGEISQDALRERCRKILAFKYALGVFDASPLPEEGLLTDLTPSTHKQLIENLNQKGMTLIQNEGELLPLSAQKGSITLLHYGTEQASTLSSTIRSNVSVQVLDLFLSNKASQAQRTKTLEKISSPTTLLIILTSGSRQLPKELTAIAQKHPSILVMMNSPYALLNHSSLVKACKGFCIGYENTPQAQKAMGRALSGVAPFEGKLPVDLSPIAPFGKGILLPPPPSTHEEHERGKLNAQKSEQIDQIALEGISKGAYPGCQILIAQKGEILYNKAFGTKDSKKKEPNTPETLYDLASITKAAATTPLIMMMYDEGKLALNDKISKHLTELRGSQIANVTIAELLHHIAGMPATIPFYKSLIDPSSYTPPLISYTPKTGYPIQFASRGYARGNFRYLPSLVSKDSSEVFSLRFTPELFLHHSVKDTIYDRIKQITPRRGGYRYSDIDFILLQQIVERISKKSLAELFDERLATPLRTHRLLFNPYIKYPSEEFAEGMTDPFLRKTTLRGDVDDEAAAMLGGISGNAGLYGNAQDLYELLQMLLDKGTRNGTQLIKKETVKLFTSKKHPLSPYALGFDRHRKQEKNSNTSHNTPPSTYGHTGFTGTCFWIDPDHEIVYIFLSNRGAPKRWNSKLSSLKIRKRIQEVIYS